ncbi:hypothetical protein Tco_1022414 [Tanacetum coccineum]
MKTNKLTGVRINQIQEQEKTGYEATKAKTSGGLENTEEPQAYNLRVRFKDNRRKGLQVSDKGTVYVREEAKEMRWLDLRLICSDTSAS